MIDTQLVIDEKVPKAVYLYRRSEVSHISVKARNASIPQDLFLMEGGGAQKAKNKI